ncbi:MAG: hypothetical protein WC455_29365 [Dehalococcoidia bacterium]|jgi:hypothetical protein
MALNAATVWEIRAAGSQANGGGFYDRSPGTSVDYSQQDAAQLTVTDLATDGAGTGLSSATGGFTAAMVGNIIHITGGTLTAGWYEITAYTDTNTVTIDRSAGASKTGGTGNVGGAFLYGGSLDGEFALMQVDGNKVWIKAGTYTQGESVTWAAASAATPQIIEGYNTSRGDSPVGNNRPLIVCGENTLNFNSYAVVSNLRFTTTASSGVAGGIATVFFNCKAQNLSESANRYAFNASNSYCSFIQCEAESTIGSGVVCGIATQIAFCYIHDSSIGVYTNSAGVAVVGTVIDSCASSGLNIAGTGALGGLYINNTIYNCGNGIASKGAQSIVMNNIISGCTTGANWDTNVHNSGNIWDYNCFYNTTDRTNVTAGAHDIDADPLLTDPSNGDFALSTGSPCFASGMTLDASVGL